MGIDINYLKERMKAAGRTPDQAASAMGMNTATYYRKLKADGVKFTVDEMQRIIQFLNLTEEDAARIFFAETVA